MYLEVFVIADVLTPICRKPIDMLGNNFSIRFQNQINFSFSTKFLNSMHSSICLMVGMPLTSSEYFLVVTWFDEIFYYQYPADNRVYNNKLTRFAYDFGLYRLANLSLARTALIHSKITMIILKISYIYLQKYCFVSPSDWSNYTNYHCHVTIDYTLFHSTQAKLNQLVLHYLSCVIT